MSTPSFTLWLEFEHVDFSTRWDQATETFVTGGDWDRENEACNIHVTLPDGPHYGITVWTYQFLQTAIKLSKEQNEDLNGLYQRPPDLFVRELTRQCLEATITDLLRRGPLEQVLNPSVLAKEQPEDS
ncbi:hypothetical protein LGH70_04805 [Hymenobacter sp. BT635]|uniref:SOCS box domain-containing protein n=1 Tax=Hymenobacter nitidus TaxID=2880929 RepID=A0ABS8A914_9BACT|nr:hypothetical protein [Hymenobacter nitidus]MCB2376888.1 hypothetical protein [Hymenobacter nitidus]